MKLIVAVVVYNRFDNIYHWAKLWNKCKVKAELIIIHNYDNDSRLKLFCEINNIKYVKRNNVGYDIGAFQDVCRERLEGFPNAWDYLMWCVDDTLPMQCDFIPVMMRPFMSGLGYKTGISCMQLSTEISLHARTTGFVIPKAITSILQFPADPVVTKQHCYEFEHLSDNNMTQQIRRLGLDCIQAAPLYMAPLYDQGYWSRNREAIKKRHIFDRDKELLKFIT